MASVLVDRDGHVLYFHGRTEDYLAPPPGEPTRHLISLAREGLRATLRDAMRAAAEEDREIGALAPSRPDDPARPVTVTVSPLRHTGDGRLFVVTFGELAGRGLVEPGAPAASGAGRAGQAEEDHRTIEQLNTVNDQLRRKVEELEGKTNALNDLLASSDVATLLLDRELQIRWFSPAIEELTDIRPSDVDRPISHFATRLDDANLRPDAEAVLDRLVPAEAEVRTDDRSYLRRIVPYRTQDDRVDGVVVTFVDITSQKQGEESLFAAHEQLRAIFDAVRHPLLVLGTNLRVRSANASFYQTFGLDPGETGRTMIYELGQGQWDIPDLRRQLVEVLPRERSFDDVEVEHEFVGLGRRTMLLNARQIEELEMILLSIEDVTERKRWEERQQMLLRELSHRVKNMLATVRAIASQTARGAPDMETFQRAFGDRLGALDAVHTLLIDGQWRSVRLHAVLALPLSAYEAEDGERVRITGEDFALTPKAALAVSMVVNELATNAAKYGALSTPSGRIEITTGLSESDLGQVVSVTWRESGGPRVEPPSASGFGHTLVERSINYELDGETRIDFEPDGLRCALLIPYNPETVQAD